MAQNSSSPSSGDEPNPVPPLSGAYVDASDLFREIDAAPTVETNDPILRHSLQNLDTFDYHGMVEFEQEDNTSLNAVRGSWQQIHQDVRQDIQQSPSRISSTVATQYIEPQQPDEHDDDAPDAQQPLMSDEDVMALRAASEQQDDSSSVSRDVRLYGDLLERLRAIQEVASGKRR